MSSAYIVSSVQTVLQLQDAFQDNFDTLDICQGLLGLGGAAALEQTQEAKEELLAIRDTVITLRSSVASSQESLAKARALLQTVSGLNSRAEHMRQHLPSHLPHAADTTTTTTASQHHQHRPRPDLSQCGGQDGGGGGASALKGSCGKRGDGPVQQVQYVTVDEFSEVPKYIRGRITYDQVNKIVDDLNTALTAKYSLLCKHRSKLSLTEMKLVNTLKGQNSEQTKGRKFVCSDDLKRWCVKVDSNLRSVLTVLRTTGKCQEIRGPAALIRYALPYH